MKKLAIPALAMGLALGACAEANAPAEDAGAETDAAMTAPAPADTVIVDEASPAPQTDGQMDDSMDDPEGSSLTVDGADVDATIGEDGVQADVDAN